MKTRVHGPFKFMIDRPKGYVKSWPRPDGSKKTFVYPCDYGYFPGVNGEDGEGLDAFVGSGTHYECFQKLKKNDDGQDVLDETKFLIGVSDEERRKIYELYGSEVWNRRVFRGSQDVLRHLEEFHPVKKPRYLAAPGAAKKAALRNCLEFYAGHHSQPIAEQIFGDEAISSTFNAADRDSKTTGREFGGATLFQGDVIP